MSILKPWEPGQSSASSSCEAFFFMSRQNVGSKLEFVYDGDFAADVTEQYVSKNKTIECGLVAIKLTLSRKLILLQYKSHF